MNTQIENQLVTKSGERLISKQELACRLKKSVRTISKWQRCGIIPFVKCRRAVFYDWQLVLEHLQQRQKGQPVADSRPQNVPALSGPVRLPVYAMREEPATQGKCRRRTSTRTNNYENENNTQT